MGSITFGGPLGRGGTTLRQLTGGRYGGLVSRQRPARIGGHSSSTSRKSTRSTSVSKASPTIKKPEIPAMDEYQSMLQGIIEKYRPGGPFEEAGLEQLKRKRIKGTAQRMQNLVSKGLTGTTQAGLVETKFEEEVGMPYKLGLEEQRTAGLTQALQSQVGMQEKMAALQQQRDIAQEKLKQQYDEFLASQTGSTGPSIIGTVTDLTPGPYIGE